ncbi:lytic transglycosylase domain-containing protein [bacterium]|nr:lytic transglycosylase domain-containing protein [bacterium]
MSKLIRTLITVAAAILLLGLGVGSPAAAQTETPKSRPSAIQAYREVVAWGLGVSQAELGSYMAAHATELDEIYANIERAAYRYGIIPEFALAMVSAENRYGAQISWARYDSWAYFELSTGQKVDYPHAYNDLATALSELNTIMANSTTMEEVFSAYWCGPNGEFNASSLQQFSDAASKIWNGLEPYVAERKAAEARNKYTPQYQPTAPPDEPSWAGLAHGDLSGYRSSMNSMPVLAEQLVDFGTHEDQYAAVIKGINKKLSDNEARIIARSILTYCQQTSYGDKAEFWVDPRLIMAIVRAESAFKPRAVSKVGALGLGQLMPATAKNFGIKDPFDPIQNLYGCVKYNEREMYRWRDHKNWLDLVIASYNAGAGAVQKYGGIPPYDETRNFVRIVKKYYYELAPEMK